MFHVSNILRFQFISKAHSYIKASTKDNNLDFNGHKEVSTKNTDNNNKVNCKSIR
jgi:hypothetical protein